MATQHIPAVGSHVILSGGKKSGSVTSLVTAEHGETVAGFVVHYGWRKRKAKVVPISGVKWVNENSVVLELSRKQFDALNDWVAPTTSSDQTAGSGASGTAAQNPVHP